MILTIFLKKFFWEKWAILTRKWHILITQDQLRIFKKFYRMKGANRYMKNLLVVFRENISFGAIWSFQSLGYFLLFNWECSKFSQATATIGSLNCQDMVSFMTTTGSWNSQGIIRILKQSRRDLSAKNLYNGYCMDIMLCLCVEVKIYGFVKLL